MLPRNCENSAIMIIMLVKPAATQCNPYPLSALPCTSHLHKLGRTVQFGTGGVEGKLVGQAPGDDGRVGANLVTA